MRRRTFIGYGAAMDLPAAFLQRLEAELGTERASAVAAALGDDKDAAYWINPLREGETPRCRGLGRPVSVLAEIFVCPGVERERLVRHTAASRGPIYLLDPSSVLAVQALAPQPGEAVLDLAAAPAARMCNAGSILAVDAVKSRFFRLRANLERCGVANTRCRLDDGRNFGHRMPEQFDRVLLDAPCSSEARIRAGEPATLRHWSPRKVREAAHKQRGLIRSAFACLKPGGTLVYCTCSCSRRETKPW